MAQVAGPAIFPAVSRADPKHGRWILPLVVAGIIGFTYLFVTALPPAPVAPSDTTVASVETTVPPAAATTTIPPAQAAFLAAVDDLASRTAAMAEEAQTINTNWDEDTASSAETNAAFTDLVARSEALAAEISALDVPQPATDAWAGVILAATEFSTAAAGMLDGFANQPGSEGRLAALDQYTTTAAAMASGFADARTAVTG